MSGRQDTILFPQRGEERSGTIYHIRWRRAAAGESRRAGAGRDLHLSAAEDVSLACLTAVTPDPAGGSRSKFQQKGVRFFVGFQYSSSPAMGGGSRARHMVRSRRRGRSAFLALLVAGAASAQVAAVVRSDSAGVVDTTKRRWPEVSAQDSAGGSWPPRHPHGRCVAEATSHNPRIHTHLRLLRLRGACRAPMRFPTIRDTGCPRARASDRF
jgi:hypothetical protein